MPRKSLWLGVLLTVVFLWLAFRGIDFVELGGALGRADYRFAVPALAATAIGYLLRALRWQLIVASERRVRYSRALSVLTMGFAANNVLPARLGELVRAMLLQRFEGVRASFALATIFLERVADGLTLVLMLVVLSLLGLVPGVRNQFARLELIAAAVFVGLTAFIVLTMARRDVAVSLFSLATRPLPGRARGWSDGLFHGFLDGLAAVQAIDRLVGVAALSLAVWSAEALSYFWLTDAFGLGMTAGTRVALACTVLVLVNLSIMIPSAPGYVGTFEFAARYALGLFGVAPEVALAYAIVAHGIQYALVSGAGLLFFAREHVSLGALARGAAAPDDARSYP
jgi:uncharacterized protein (TIRG00374 family)